MCKRDARVFLSILLIFQRGCHHFFFVFLFFLLKLQLELSPLLFIKLFLVSGDPAVKDIPEDEDLVIEGFKSAEELGVPLLHIGQVYCVSDVLWQPPVSLVFPMVSILLQSIFFVKLSLTWSLVPHSVVFGVSSPIKVRKELEIAFLRGVYPIIDI